MSTQSQEAETAGPAMSAMPAAARAGEPHSAAIAAAYRVCEEIARREARNFYYAFRALPRAKRNAICAVYAFMRRADDLADDESLPRSERRIALGAWLASWHQADQTGRASSSDPTTNAVFLALADAKMRFGISSELLDELVQGTAMDLQDPPHRPHPRSSFAESYATEQKPLDVYPTFDALYRYCYLVASVVGLVCIRIFGYEDQRAEKLAEETGIAFQLTNILRDVREDAERGRVYVPVEDLALFGLIPEDIVHAAAGHTPNHREVLALEAKRAERYYQSAQALLPLIAADSRPALWVLVTIYHRLLERIVARNYDVFTEKVRVPTAEKLWILAQGMARVFAYRLRRG